MKLRITLALLCSAGPALAQAFPMGVESMPREPGADLSAASAASPRPRECSAEDPRALRDSQWDRARRPKIRAYCDALARGYAELARAPSKALASAARAKELGPERAAPLVLEGRAWVGSGRAAEAWPLFERAQKLDKLALAEPAALHDLALAAGALGKHAETVAAYRALVPRAGMLADPRRRQRVYLEAAMAVMRSDANALDEALGYLAEARRLRGMPGLSDLVLGATALTLDRQGRRDEARGVVAEARGALGVSKLADSARAREALVSLPAGEVDAIAAILVERVRPELAKRHWRAFVESPESTSSPWLAHAKKRLESVAAAPRRAGRQ